MTNMTSLATNNKQTPSLTDFSIHSIIHGVESSRTSNGPSSSSNLTTGNNTDTLLPVRLGDRVSGPQRQQQQQPQPQQATIRKYRPKNFRCPACKMAFSNNGQLKNHVRIHTGERPFQCDIASCRKTFTRNEELTRHKLIHTGFRPHACITCGKRFGRKDHLKKHLRTHERKKLRRRSSLIANTHNQLASSVANNSRQEANCYLGREVTAAAASTNQETNVKSMNCGVANVCSGQHIPLSFPPALISAPHPLPLLSHHLPSTTTTTNFSTHLSATKASFQHKPFLMPSNTIEQIASDYWNKWYNIFGFYHNQNAHQPVVVSTSLPTAALASSSLESFFSKHI